MLEQEQGGDQEQLLRSNGQQSADDSERALAGRERERIITLPVRRMFCALVIFDVVLTFIMWYIYFHECPSIDETRYDYLYYGVNILFVDIISLALFRGLVLLTAYSCICRTKKMYCVVITTSITSIWLVIKVFITEFKGDHPLRYLLIISSLVFCWCELWYFIFHVVPRERAEELPLNDHRRSEELRSLQASGFFTAYSGSIYRGESIIVDDDHISARSLSEDLESTWSNVSAELKEVAAEDHLFIKTSISTAQRVFQMLYMTDGWHTERVEQDGICVSTKLFEGIGKVYKLESVIDVPSTVLDKLLWRDVQCQPSWNTSVKECKVVRRINKQTDIVHTLAAEAGGGVIASRDFVLLRRRVKKDSLTLLSFASVETDLVPVKRRPIRGYNGPGGWIMQDASTEFNKTEFTWLLNTELRGWLLQSLVDHSLASVMVDTVRDIRKYVATLSQS